MSRRGYKLYGVMMRNRGSLRKQAREISRVLLSYPKVPYLKVLTPYMERFRFHGSPESGYIYSVRLTA